MPHKLAQPSIPLYRLHPCELGAEGDAGEPLRGGQAGDVDIGQAEHGCPFAGVVVYSTRGEGAKKRGPMLNAAIEGRLANATFEREPFFGLSIPNAVPDVPSEVLNPRNAWADKSAYDEAANHLAGLFAENFKRFEGHASPQILAVAIAPR